jgi:hypothetical protein
MSFNRASGQNQRRKLFDKFQWRSQLFSKRRGLRATKAPQHIALLSPSATPLPFHSITALN